jgi:hypothetical protein
LPLLNDSKSLEGKNEEIHHSWNDAVAFSCGKHEHYG